MGSLLRQSIPKATLAFLVTAAVAATANPNEGLVHSEWSNESNGLKARLAVRRSKVTNGSGIIATYQELKNVSDVINPLTLSATPDNMTFTVTDSDGRPVAKKLTSAFSGKEFGTLQLTLPFDSFLRVRIGPTDHGIPRDTSAHLDLGIKCCWALPNKEYDLSAVLEIPRTKQDGYTTPWHGRIELPQVHIPMTSPPPVAAELEHLIHDLGEKMLSKNGRISEAAFDQMSLINDPRVVPWYVKAVKTDRYGSKCSALDRLGYFAGDEAFEGLKLGATTEGKDVGSASNKKVAATLADNIRIYALNGLARCNHPDAPALILSLHNDSSRSIRLNVIQAAAKMATADSLAIIKSHVNDADSVVAREAKRLLSEK